jgi:dihydropteroate synthase
MEQLDAFFEEKLAIAEEAGLAPESIVLDPGIDFAKQRDDNLRIYHELSRLGRFNRPVLLPVSRKTVIADVLGLPPPERDAGTIACLVTGLLRGGSVFRVHNVKAAVQAVRVVHAIRGVEVGEPTS